MIDDLEFKRLWCSDLSNKELVKHFNCAQSTLYRKAAKMNLPSRRFLRAKLFKENWDSNLTVRQQATKFNCNERTIYRVASRLGLIKREKWIKKAKKRDLVKIFNLEDVVNVSPMNLNLQQAIQYILNSGGAPEVSWFDEDHEPIGPKLRNDLINGGYARQYKDSSTKCWHIELTLAAKELVLKKREEVQK